MTHDIATVDHVQMAMPRGAEADAEAFYVGVLGFDRVAKPEPPAVALEHRSA